MNRSSESPASSENDGERRTKQREIQEEKLRMLAAELNSNDLSALNGIWELMGDDLFGLAHWRTGTVTDAEDTVQEVFVRLARYPRKLHQARRPRSYLLTMTHHASIELIQKRRKTEGLEQIPFVVADQSDPTTALDAGRISSLLQQLSEEQRAVLYLRHFQGLRLREIAAVTGVSIFTAASRFRLGIRRLRKMMGVRT